MSQQTPKLSNLFKLEYPQSIGVFATYDEAQKAVDHLADEKFPVENLAIVGTDLRSIERVLGRRSWGTVIGQGVQSGLSTGLMVTLLMWLFMPDANFVVLLISALLIGIVIGVVFAALSYWMSQGKRDFTSVSQTVATRYELLSEHKVAAQAKELLAQVPGGRASQFDPRLAPAPGGYPPAGPVPAASGYPQPPMGYPPAPAGYPSAPPAGYPGAGYPPVGYPPVSPDGGRPPVAYPPTQPPAGYPDAGYPSQPSAPAGDAQPGLGTPPQDDPGFTPPAGSAATPDEPRQD